MAEIMSRGLVEHAEYWSLPLVGEVIVQCRYDYAFTLVVGEGRDPAVVRVENIFTLYGPDGAVVGNFDPEADPVGLGPTLRLLRATVTRASAYKDGRLDIACGEVGRLVVDPSEEFESWQFSGSGGSKVVATDGGNLAVWHEQ